MHLGQFLKIYLHRSAFSAEHCIVVLEFVLHCMQTEKSSSRWPYWVEWMSGTIFQLTVEDLAKIESWSKWKICENEIQREYRVVTKYVKS